MSSSRPAAPPEPVGTIVSSGIRVNGRVAGEEDLHVEGYVEGAVSLSETLFVAAQGIVVAQVTARNVVVSGVVVGNVAAEDSVTLNPGSKLVGDINAPRVIVSDGAAFSGNVAMNGEAPPRARPRVAARARPAARSGSVRSDTTSAGIRPAVAETTAPKIRREAPPAVTRTPAVATPEPSRAEEESTVVVRHAAIGRGDTGGAPAPKKAPPKPTNKAAKKATASGKTGKKKTKKKTPRARVPKPGKRRVTRR